jgi:hypothetical protein
MNFVDHFAAIVEPLNKLKTAGFKDAPKQGRKRLTFAEKTLILKVKVPTELIIQARKALEILKDCLYNALVLKFPNFNLVFCLYINRSREWGFGYALHQFNPTTKTERPILFLLKALSPAERSYWLTELKTAALVWCL